MNYMAETYPDTWLGVAVHNGDPMVDPPYDNAIPSIIPNFPGYPSGTIDRSGGNYYDPESLKPDTLTGSMPFPPEQSEYSTFHTTPIPVLSTFDVQSEICIDVYNELRFGV